MSENEETGWRVGAAEVGQEEKAAAPTEEVEEEEKKDELQQRVQAKEDIGGREESLITEEEVIPIIETKYESPSKKVIKTRKCSKSKTAPKKESNNTNLISMSR